MATDIRLDEGGDESWLVAQCRIAKVEGTDIILDAPDRRAGHGGDLRRALVHDTGDGLTLNFNNDYSGGVTINSARLNLRAVGSMPANGKIGDLIMLRRGLTEGQFTHLNDSCSLWLCVPGSDMAASAGRTFWSQVSLGEPVVGSS